VDCELGDGIGAIASSSRTRRTCKTMQSDAHVMQRGGGARVTQRRGESIDQGITPCCAGGGRRAASAARTLRSCSPEAAAT